MYTPSMQVRAVSGSAPCKLHDRLAASCLSVVLLIYTPWWLGAGRVRARFGGRPACHCRSFDITILLGLNRLRNLQA